MNKDLLKQDIVNNLVSTFQVDTSNSVQMDYLSKAADAIATAIVNHIRSYLEITLNLPAVQLNTSSITGTAGPYPVSIASGSTLQTTVSSSNFQVQWET